IRGQDFRANVVLLADLVGDRLQAVFAAGDQQKIVAARRKLSCEGGAQPAGCSCDDGQHLSPFPCFSADALAPPTLPRLAPTWTRESSETELSLSTETRRIPFECARPPRARS